MSRIEMVDLLALHRELGTEIEAAVTRVIRSGRYVGGPEVAKFEEAFAEFLGVKHAIAVASGTDALQLALRAAGIRPGDEVLVPANTFIATAEAVAAVGAVPRFVDVEPDNGLIDLNSATERLTSRTKGVMPVHLYGRMVDMRAVLAFADDHDLVVIEDAAQAHGARQPEGCAGTLGDAGCFSFYPGKNLGAVGDAGAAVTNDDDIAARIRLYRDHGRSGRDNHLVQGVNSRMDPIQAAVLSVKLPHLERWTAARRGVAEAYRERLGPLVDWSGSDPEAEVHHLFPALLDDRDRVEEQLRERDIASAVHYRQTMTTAPAFAGVADDCPVAEERARRQLSLPIHPHLRRDEVDQVAEAVIELTAVVR